MSGPDSRVVHRFPQSKSVDVVRWLPSVSALDRFLVSAAHEPSTSDSAVEVHSFAPSLESEPDLITTSSWSCPARISSLRCPSRSALSQVPVALSTFAGSLHYLFVDPVEGVVVSALSVTPNSADFHDGAIAAVDLYGAGSECLSVGEDGRVNLVKLGEGKLDRSMVSGGGGLVSYTAVRWASATEFVTGGLGFDLQLWDLRKPDGMTSQLKGSWVQSKKSGIIHSIDIQPSRKHIFTAGGSYGTVFAWDLRWQQKPIPLAGLGCGDSADLPCQSEVWEVQCDTNIPYGVSSVSSSRNHPVMMCSEDGILATVEQGEEVIELLVENCAINNFDIDLQNPSDVACSLEWESIAILMRPRDSLSRY